MPQDWSVWAKTTGFLGVFANTFQGLYVQHILVPNKSSGIGPQFRSLPVLDQGVPVSSRDSFLASKGGALMKLIGGFSDESTAGRNVSNNHGSRRTLTMW